MKEQRISDQRKTEIIAFCSGKGGTGKSLMCACFGYALLRGGQRVLMVDGDPATNGLSLFLLGPKGQEQVASFEDQNTFSGALERYQKTGSARFEPCAVHRRGDDHRLTYSAILSSKSLYGEEPLATATPPELNRSIFRSGARHLFDQLRSSGEFDYVLVDTRGGFSFESTDLSALADSFIVVTEPDDNSLYQDRNLVTRIAAVARDVEVTSRLRAVMVNKASNFFPEDGKPYLDTLEVPFRNQLAQELSIPLEDTHPVPVSRKALLAYKAHKSPYRSTPESLFCMATLAAFTHIASVADAPWTTDQVDRWNVFVGTIERAAQDKQAVEQKKEEARLAHEEEFAHLRAAVVEHERTITAMGREAEARISSLHREYESKVAALEQDLYQRDLVYERDLARVEAPAAAMVPADRSIEPAHEEVSLEEQGTEPEPIDEVSSFSAPEAQPREDVEVEEVPPSRPSREAFASFVNQVNGQRNGSGLVSAGLLLVLVVVVAAFFALHRNPNKAVSAARVAQPVASPPHAPVQPLPQPEPPSRANFAVLLAGGKALTATAKGAPSAAYEAQLALRSGYAVQVYQRGGRYTAALAWETRPEAEESMKEIQAPFSGRWASTSAIVPLSDWCPDKTAQEPLVINNKEVPVWSCGSSLTASSR